MRLTLWATMSCSSRAIRSRSSATATIASACRSRSSRSARSTRPPRYARLVRVVVPIAQASSTGANSTHRPRVTFGVLILGPSHTAAPAAAPAIPPATAKIRVHRSPYETAK